MNKRTKTTTTRVKVKVNVKKNRGIKRGNETGTEKEWDKGNERHLSFLVLSWTLLARSICALLWAYCVSADLIDETLFPLRVGRIEIFFEKNNKSVVYFFMSSNCYETINGTFGNAGCRNVRSDNSGVPSTNTNIRNVGKREEFSLFAHGLWHFADRREKRENVSTCSFRVNLFDTVIKKCPCNQLLEMFFAP